MATPGYYKTNYRALRLREHFRMRGFWRGIRRYLDFQFLRPVPTGWMPGVWSKIECRREDLSEGFWQATKPHRRDFEQLGFKECGLIRIPTLNPATLDTGGVTYLNPTQCHFGQIFFIRNQIRTTGRVVNEIVIAFTAVFENGNFSCTNNKSAFDPLKESRVVRVKSYDVKFIYQQFLEHVRERKDAPRRFSDLESLRQWFDASQVKVWEERVRRRLFLPMSDAEVEAAKAVKALGTPPSVPRRRFRISPLQWVMWALILMLFALLKIAGHSRLQPGGMPNHVKVENNTIEYHGQQFKMRKAYETYEDYKDDPDNLDTNELGRIEQAMISVKVPKTFRDREEFIGILLDMGFPGYGIGGIGNSAKADDGSRLEIEAIEIPQREKNRVIVVRDLGTQLKLVDDFVYSTATNQIQNAKLEKQVMRYYDDQGRVMREKRLSE